MDDSLRWDGYDTYPAGWSQRSRNLYSNIAVDHIEKRPLFHFMPGAKCLAVGYYGCNLHCSYCQNHEISQPARQIIDFVLNNADIAVMAENAKVDVIAFTFNEPTLFYKDICHIAARTSKPIVVKTNGHASMDVWNALRCVVSAYNVDIKGTEQEYRNYGGLLQTVKESIQRLVSLEHHVEISYVVSSSQLRNLTFHREMADWIAAVGQIPVHILMMYPCHNVSDSYLAEELIPVYDALRAKLDFVYISNVFDSKFSVYRDSHCPICHRFMVSRHDQVKIHKLECCGQRYFR